MLFACQEILDFPKIMGDLFLDLVVAPKPRVFNPVLKDMHRIASQSRSTLVAQLLDMLWVLE